jgi:hypothetical protein
MSIFDTFKNGTVATFYSSGINWTWYLEVRSTWKYGRPKVEILRHYRIHNGDDGQPETLGQYEIIENNQRIACAVELRFKTAPNQCPTVCAIDNPRGLFDYH